METMRRLTVLYDASCPLCLRCRDWIGRQRSYLPLALVPAGSREAADLLRGFSPPAGDLAVVADDGRVWLGPAAFLVCLWALRDWREWSYRLAAPGVAPLARAFFVAVSASRGPIGRLLDERCEGGACAHRLRAAPGAYR